MVDILPILSLVRHANGISDEGDFIQASLFVIEIYVVVDLRSAANPVDILMPLFTTATTTSSYLLLARVVVVEQSMGILSASSSTASGRT